MNRVTLLGRVTSDVEAKEYGKGKEKGKYANFTIAVRKDNDNTDFINCTAFGMTAELLEKYVSKGQRILAEGRIVTDKYEDDDKKTHNITKVIINNVEFADGKK